MGESFIINLGRQSIWLIIITSGPLLLAALIIGVLISVFQAVTQIQDMTLTFVPKFFAILFLLVVLGGILLGNLQVFTINLFSSIAFFAR
jgi:flagellar biosynthesis protein FliQ